MVFEKGVPLPVDAEYEDPHTQRIAQRIQAAKDEVGAAIKELILRYNLSTDIESAVEVPGKKIEPQYCHICNQQLRLYGVNSVYCPCWSEANSVFQEEDLPEEPPFRESPGQYREICSRMGCSSLHDDLCCLCGLALCEEHMSIGCCGHTPAISDRVITKEFQLEKHFGDEANEEQAVQEVQYV